MTTQLYTGTNAKDGKLVFDSKQSKSKTELGQCKNEDCTNNRRHCSAYCEECSKKFK